MMAPPDPAIVSEGISRFLKDAQERAYAEKMSSFEEIVISLRAANTGLQHRHSQEISSLKAIVESLQASTKECEANNANIQAHHSQEISSLQTSVQSLKGFAKKADADNNQLRVEIAELRTRLGHTENLSVEGEAPRAHGPSQSGTKLQEPSQRRSLHSRFVRNTDEQHETNTNPQFLPFNDQSRIHGPNPGRPTEQQHPRGIKRAHVEDTADLPHRPTPAEEARSLHGFERPQGQKTHQSKRFDHKHTHDEMPGPEGREQSQMKDRAVVRRDEFAAYYNSMRREYKNNQERDQGALIRRFIDGIPDPDYACWFQGALKQLFPESVHDAKRPELIPGNRTITLKKNLTWEDAKTVVKEIRIPTFND